MSDSIETQIAEQEQALALAEQSSDQRMQLEFCDRLGHLYGDQRDYEQSRRYYQQATTLASQLKDASFLFRLGISLSVMNEYPQSTNCLKQALQINLEDTTTEKDALRVLNFLADQYKNFLDDRPQAITYYQQALELAQKLDDSRHQLRNLRDIGDCYQEMEQYSQALDHYNLALQIARQDNDLVEQSAMLTNSAYLYTKMGDEQKRDALFGLALSVAEASTDISAQTSVLIWQGHAFRDQDDLVQCARCYYQALALAQEHQDVTHISSCLSLLAHLAQKQNQLQEAIDLYQQEIQVLGEDRLKSVNRHRNGFLHFSYTHALESLGELYEQIGDVQTALTYMEQALDSETIMAGVQHLNEQITRLHDKLNPSDGESK